MWPAQSLSEIMRPKTLKDLALPLSCIERFEGMVRAGQIQNLLLSGDPGTGKTSTVQILSHAINADVHDFTGALAKDFKRSSFDGNSLVSLLENRPLVYVIEDAEHIPPRIQAMFRGWTEALLRDAPLCRFIFTTNDLKKFDGPLRSRLTHISYYLLPSERHRIMDELHARYEKVFGELDVSLSQERLREIIALKFPDFRATANEIEGELLAKRGENVG